MPLPSIHTLRVSVPDAKLFVSAVTYGMLSAAWYQETNDSPVRLAPLPRDSSV